MFGVYYLFIGMGNKLAGLMGGMIETQRVWVLFNFTIVPIGAGLIMIPLSPYEKLMHGVK
jgi:POT family proton-dependent oligopeptide transporter